MLGLIRKTNLNKIIWLPLEYWTWHLKRKKNIFHRTEKISSDMLHLTFRAEPGTFTLHGFSGMLWDAQIQSQIQASWCFFHWICFSSRCSVEHSTSVGPDSSISSSWEEAAGWPMTPPQLIGLEVQAFWGKLSKSSCWFSAGSQDLSSEPYPFIPWSTDVDCGISESQRSKPPCIPPGSEAGMWMGVEVPQI